MVYCCFESDISAIRSKKVHGFENQCVKNGFLRQICTVESNSCGIASGAAETGHWKSGIAKIVCYTKTSKRHVCWLFEEMK